MQQLLSQIRTCQLCAQSLPLGAKPIVQFNTNAKLLILGQAPGRLAHDHGLPFADPSGQRLRQWLQLPEQVFYNQNAVAILPMAFCYPGKTSSGDLPPSAQCAPQWHQQVLSQLTQIKLRIYLGQFAQRAYLPVQAKRQTLTQRVASQPALPLAFCLPHPSPRNNRWFAKNPWFEMDVLPQLRAQIANLFKDDQTLL